VELARTGCDGTCWAQPVVTVRGSDGSVARYERVEPVDVPAILDGSARPAEGDPFEGQVRRVLARCGVVDPGRPAGARTARAYAALKLARAISPEELAELVREAGLRGRGGAYFPLAAKWSSARGYPGPRYLVVNAEEGEPGAFKDRHLMEGDPHLLVE